MNLMVFACGKDVYINCEYIKGNAFKMDIVRDCCVLLIRKTANSDFKRDQSVHFDRKRSLSPGLI